MILSRAKKPKKRKKRSNGYSRYTPEYMEWRAKVYEKDEKRCLRCNRRTKRPHIHHIVPYSKNLSLRLNIENGATLCKRCHKKYHSLYGTTKNVNRDTFNEFIETYRRSLYENSN